MTRGVCVIGIGGTGQSVLIALKERLIEIYGRVPNTVVLLSLDVAAPEATMTIGGVKLNMRGVHRPFASQPSPPVRSVEENVDLYLSLEREWAERDRAPEFHPLIIDRSQNVDEILSQVAMGIVPHHLEWVKGISRSLNNLPPEHKIIPAGAGQRRPLGRLALFLDYDQLYAEISSAFSRLFATPPNQGDRHEVYVVGSVAGGTGSGAFIDVLNVIAKLIEQPEYQLATMSAFVVLPSAFQDHIAIKDKSNLQPNSYAALRELNRFQLTHANTRPTLVRYGPGPTQHYLYWVTKPLASHVYLIDTTVPGVGGSMGPTDPRYTVFPMIADYMAAKVVDARTPDGNVGGGGFAITALENNFDVTLSERWRGRQYLGLNTFTYIVPINDIVRSVCLRYLHEMYGRLFAEPRSPERVIQMRQAAAERVDAILLATVVSTFNRNGVPETSYTPPLMRAVIAATQPKDPQKLAVDWASLLAVLACSSEEYHQDYQALQQSLDCIEGEPLTTVEYSRKNKRRESFEEGAERLVKTAERLMDRYLGRQIDPRDLQSRRGGEWDVRLAKYDELQEMFAEALDVMVRDELNRRDNHGKLLPNRLSAARALVETIRDRLRTVVRQVDMDLSATGTPDRLGELIMVELKQAQAEMEATMHETFVPLLAERPLKAQKAFIAVVNEYLHLELMLRLFARTRRTLDMFGAEDEFAWKDDSGRVHKEPSIVVRALQGLDKWDAMLRETDTILERVRERHARDREEKKRIRVRQYLTDAEYEDKVYAACLGTLDKGFQEKGEGGVTLRLHWVRKLLHHESGAEPPLSLDLMTAWDEQLADGPVEFAVRFMEGASQIVDPIVRRAVTIANRLYDSSELRNQPERLATALDQKVDRPLLRYQATGRANTYRVMSFPFLGRPEAQQFMQKMAQAWRFKDAQARVDARNTLEPSECASALTVISFTGAFAMSEIQQFAAAEMGYRTKILQDEPLHVFPEEQLAAQIEQSTPSVFPRQATPRTFSPEVVVCMADKKKLEVFAAACVYGIIKLGIVDSNAPIPTHEVFLFLDSEAGPGYERKQLSCSRAMDLPPGQRPSEGRLFLDALQQFCIVKAERIDVGGDVTGLVARQIQKRGLRDQDYVLSREEQISPFSLRLNTVEKAIVREKQRLSPSPAEEPDLRKREQTTAQRCLARLAEFKRIKVDAWMDEDSDVQVQDLGILMALLLQEQVERLRRLAGDF